MNRLRTGRSLWACAVLIGSTVGSLWAVAWADEPAPPPANHSPADHSPATGPATSPATGPATAPIDPRLLNGDIDSSKAWLVHVPGIAGETRIDHKMVDGLRDGGFDGPMEIFDWTGTRRGLAALTNRQKNDEQAKVLADKIIAHHKAHPNGQILLTGHSGGTGIIVFALEKLPPGAIVDGVLLLSPALSVNYDLTAALSRVRGKAYVFSSTLDVFVLGLGTKVFGTMDRLPGESAGRVGFVMPEAGDARQYRKLVPCPYEKAWEELGNVGDHVTCMSRQFARRVLTPLLVSQLPGSPGPLIHPVVLPQTKPAQTQPAAE